MIPKIDASTIYSTLGNNSSLIPLAIKDIANSCGLTTASYIAGDKVEGKDRFIDEFGTQAIWLWGIPAYKKILDLPLFKAFGFDKDIDARILKDKNILKLAQDFAPTESIKTSIEKAAKHATKFKALTVAKFILSTGLTAATYFGLTKFRHNYTKEQIKQDYFKHQQQKEQQSNNIAFSSAFSDIHHSTSQKNKKVSFTGGIEDFMFNPVRNLMLVDATITTERLTNARNKQDLMGYAIKEGSFWLFMYLAGPIISKAMEKFVDSKLNKNISLDTRILESKKLENFFKNGKLQKQIEEFELADKSDAGIYKFIVSQDKPNLIIDLAKKAGIIEMTEDNKHIDTRRFIDLNKMRGLKNNLAKLLTQHENSGVSVEEFLKSVRHLKRMSVITNIGACITALGIIAPSIMLYTRKNQEFKVKEDIENQLKGQNAKQVA